MKHFKFAIFAISLVMISFAIAGVKTNKKKEEKKSMIQKEVSVLGGGCFWGMEDLLRKIPGVLHTEVGYSGGDSKNPTYIEVKTGASGHAEVVKIEFDPKVLSFENLLMQFFKMHDPTTANQQGNDIGTQYRSVIFYFNDEQKKTAEKMIERVNKSNAWGAPAVTQVVAAKPFYTAEEYHQDYLQKQPDGYTCHYLRNINF